MNTIDVSTSSRDYPVHLGEGLLQSGSLWQSLVTGSQALVVTNETIAPLYLDTVTTSLGCLDHQTHVLPDGERYKTAEHWLGIIDALTRMRASRDVTVIALGGGVVGDVAGFAAASYMRGVRLLQAPTTLLAMVDAAVGGKTAINLAAGKNLVGAFYQPHAVVADTRTLATLDAREYNAGVAEVVKYGALGDVEFFAWLERNSDALLAREGDALDHAVATSIAAKAAIVQADELESGRRALLNLGHTFGHAIETETGYDRYLHGEAVAIGMVLAARLSAFLARAGHQDAERLEQLLQQLDLPTRLPPELNNEATHQRLLEHMKLDKKNQSGNYRLILLHGIGEAFVCDDVRERHLAEFFQDQTSKENNL